MADISVIKMPNNTSYNLKDAAAREALKGKVGFTDYANSTTGGVVKVAGEAYGISIGMTGFINVAKPTDAQVLAGSNNYKPIVPSLQHLAVFYGLAKAAGDITQAASSNAVGTYTDGAKAAIQSMLGINSLLAPVEADLTADQAYAINNIFSYNSKLYKATTAIAIGDTITPGTNCAETSISENFVKYTDHANGNTTGVVKVNGAGNYGISINENGGIRVKAAISTEVKAGTDQYKPIVPNYQHHAVFYGLSKVAGVDLSSENVTVGTYPETSKTAIRAMLGAVGTTDYATTENYGLVKIGARLEINPNTGKLIVTHATIDQIKSRSNERVLTPMNQHYATFYGLGRVAGISSNYSVGDVDTTTEIGTYSDAAKAAIQSMLGINSMLAPVESDLTADQAYAIDDIFSYNGKLYKATAAITSGGTITPSTNCIETTISETYIKNTDYATGSTAGVIKASSNVTGIGINNHGYLYISPPTKAEIKTGTDTQHPVTPSKIKEATFYGLAKAAGDTTQASSSNAVGTYTDTAKAAIQTMLSVPSSSDLNNKVDKSAIEDAGITGYTYSTLFGGQFSVTTAASNDYINPYARASVTGRISKHHMHRVTFNGTEYILPTRMWFINDGSLKVYEYLGNLNLFISDVSGVPDGTDNVPFVIISDLNDSSSIDVLTQTAGTHTIKIERIIPTKKDLPKSIIYGDNYAPIEKKNNGGTYNGFSIGLNELKNTRATIAIGYGNQIAHEFSTLIGLKNVTNSGLGYAFGSSNSVSDGFAIGKGNNVSNIGFAFGTSNNANNGYSIGHSLISTNNILALGQNNIEDSTVIPEWTENTAYTVGQIVIKSPYPSSWLCAEDHISSSNFLSDLGAGKWNVSLVKSDTVLLVGNGVNEHNRSNALRINLAGDTHIKGNVYVNCNADSSGGTKLVNQTDYATANTAGVVKVNSNFSTGTGIGINNNGVLTLETTTDAVIKDGTTYRRVLMPHQQHIAAFYGLAKAAGTDEKNSTLPLGTYSQTAKTAIQTMLGVESGVSFVEQVSGTTPSIVGVANTRYICGEVSTLSITPPSTGIIDITFTSGSTATILTIPNTVIFPAWFDTTSLEVNTVYEINIMDGTRGVVTTW